MPRARHVYPTGLSSTLPVFGKRRIEIVRDPHFAAPLPEDALTCTGNGNQSNDWNPRAGDHDVFAGERSFHELGKLDLRFMHVHRIRHLASLASA